MSIAQNPVTGQMKKSFANVNTYVHKGQNVISSKVFNRKDSNTDAQKTHRASFKLVSEFWSSLAGFAEHNFPGRPEKMSPFNYFMYLNLPVAIDTSGEIPVFNYDLLQVSKGSYTSVIVNSAILDATGLKLNCNSNAGFPNSAATDVVTVLVKTTAGSMYVAQPLRGTEETSSIQVTMPATTIENIEFIVVFVNSADGKKVSKSQFVQVIE